MSFDKRLISKCSAHFCHLDEGEIFTRSLTKIGKKDANSTFLGNEKYKHPNKFTLFYKFMG
jgi:hypothetical protein